MGLEQDTYDKTRRALVAVIIASGNKVVVPDGYIAMPGLEYFEIVSVNNHDGTHTISTAGWDREESDSVQG